MATLQTVLGTTGDDTLSTDLLTDFVVDGLAGDDTITIEETASSLQIQARNGEDLIVGSGDISASDKIKGGADSDTFDFQGAVASSSIYGGKAGDSIVFARTLTGGLVSGDTGNDTITLNGKISGGALIDGGSDDDLITLNERITSSTVLGGAAQDTIIVGDNSESAFIKAGSDDDSISLTGKHGSLNAKGNAGDDTISVASGLSGTGNSVFGGKGEDVFTLGSTAKVTLSGDKDDDSITVDADVVSTGATLLGGEGDDTITAAAADSSTSTKFSIKGDNGDDKLTGSTGVDSIFGGKGEDTISAASGGKKTFSGDLGDDDITLNTVAASSVSGGDGDDTIDVDAVATDNKGGHSIFGGAGADVFELLTSSPTAENTDIATTSDTTRLIYSSFADFHKEGDLVDSGKIADSDVVIAVIPEKLTIKNTDEFDRIEMADGAVRGANEGLYIATSDDVTAGSSVVLSATADDYLNGIDLSAATTGNSSIDASAADNTAANLFLIGGAGKNTIKGGAGGDVITGGAKADTLIGGAGDDTITGSGGLDTMTGGTGANDFIQKNLVASNSAVLTTITDFTLGGSDDDLGGFSITNLESLGSDFDLVTGAGASIASNTSQLVYNFASGADIGAAANTIITYGEIGDGSTGVVETAIETGGSKATTFGAMEANDAILALWDDGTDAYLGVVKTTAAIIDGQAAASGKLEVTKLIVLEDIANAEAFVTNDTLAFVA